MGSAIIQDEYDLLTETLHTVSASERNQLALIGRWLGRAYDRHDKAMLRSYTRELLSRVFLLIPSIQPIGCTPEFFSSLRNTIRRIEESDPALFFEEEFFTCAEHLLRHEQTIHAWLGCPPLNGPVHEFSTGPVELDERQTLDHLIEELQSGSELKAELYRGIARDWDDFIRTDPDCAQIPLLETEHSGGMISGFHPFGKIARLRVTIHSNGNDTDKDIISFPQLLDHAVSSGVEEELRNAAEATRIISAKLFHISPKKCINCHVAFDDSRIHTSGRSLGLGFALALHSAQSRLIISRQYSLISGENVLTGMIHPSGAVLSLDDEHVRRKTEALFFSPYRRLVLPKENETAAAETLRSLEARYPTRHLELLPLRRAWDAVQHRQVLEVRQYSMKQRITRRVKHHQTQIAIGALVMMFLLGASYFLFIADWDDNPYHVVVYGNDYQIRNTSGKVLWKQPFNPPETPRIEKPSIAVFCDPYTKQFAVVDLDFDGRNEVLLGHYAIKHGFSDSVYCYNSDGTRRWATAVGGPVITTENVYTTHAFGVRHIWVGELDTTGEKRIVVTTSHDFYPSFLYVLDIEGRILKSYLHLGAINDLAVFDSDVPGKKNIFVTATHNGFHSGVVFLLDPDIIEGVCPQEDRIRLLKPKLPPGTEKMYLKLPKSHVYHAYQGSEKNPFPFIRSVSKTSVQVALYEAPSHNSPVWVVLRYDFTEDLQPLSLSTSTEYDTNYERALKNGLTSKPLSKQYLDSLLAETEYWDGEKFVKTQTMNRFYLEAVAKSTGKKN